MAEDSGQERTEEPTAKRLDDARRKGQIPRSRELNTFVILLTGVLGCSIFGEFMVKHLRLTMTANFQLERKALFDPNFLLTHFNDAFTELLLLLAPLLMLMTFAALAAPLGLGGWLFSWNSLVPKLSKLNPLAGLKRMFAIRGLVELVKSLLKVVMLGGAAVLVLKAFLSQILGLLNESLVAALTHSLSLLWLSTLFLCLSLVLLVGIDVPYQLWDYKRKLKMTLQEVKDEMKESEGRPEVKGKIRQLQRERAQGRMMDEVPKADVVVTNPSHFAVALRYDQAAGGAPRVVAKGVDLIAAQIRSRAVAAEVPLVAAPPLARALYYSTELEQEIPEGLYLAVAQVLAYVYQLRTTKNPAARPAPPSELPVPEEFLRQDKK